GCAAASAGRYRRRLVGRGGFELEPVVGERAAGTREAEVVARVVSGTRAAGPGGGPRARPGPGPGRTRARGCEIGGAGGPSGGGPGPAREGDEIERERDRGDVVGAHACGDDVPVNALLGPVDLEVEGLGDLGPDLGCEPVGLGLVDTAVAVLVDRTALGGAGN